MDLSLNTIQSPLGESYRLKCSETDIMETINLALYNFGKTGDAEILRECSRDISGIIERESEGITEGCLTYKGIVPSYDAFIMKHSKFIISEAPDDAVTFDIIGYPFSVIDAPRIDFSEFEKVIDSYDTFHAGIIKIMSGNDSQEVEDVLNDYMNDSNLSEIRGKVLGSKRKIYELDFMNDVRKFYRSGSSRTEEIHITRKYIKNEVVGKIKDIQKDFDRTDKELKQVNTLFLKGTALIKHTQLSCERMSGSPEGIIIRNNLFNLKYSQLVFLENCYRTILTERIRALNDQMSQNLEIFKHVMNFCSNNNDSGETVAESIRSSLLFESTDYTEAALEDMILTQSSYTDIMEARYALERDFVTRCLEAGAIQDVMEAGSLSHGYQTVKAALIKFIDKIIAMVREKVVSFNQKYVPWLKDVGEDKLKEKAKTVNSITTAPYYDGDDLSGDLRDIVSAINDASGNTDKNDLSYMKKFVDGFNTQQNYDDARADLSGYLKNYFRFHKKNAKSVKKVELSGKDLESKVPTMFKYIMQYEKNVKSLDNLKKTLESSLKSMEDDKVMDSLLYLQSENRHSINTDLALLEGYQVLLEADNDDKAGTVVNDKGEAESPTKIETSEQKEKEEAKKNGETPTSSSKYTSTFRNFFQLTISAYITAMEERYINYIDILSQLAGGRPKIDKNGKYIPKEEPTKESVLPENFYRKPAKLKGLSLYQ